VYICIDYICYADIGHSVNENEAPAVRTAAALFQEMCYQNKDNLSAGIIVAGWDKTDGPSVYNIPLGGSLHKAPFAIGGMLTFDRFF
jgi:20S proteasome subunit beta 1